MRRLYVWLAIAAGVVVVMTAGASRAIAALTQSPTAKKLGISNAPSSTDDASRLEWLWNRKVEIEALLLEKFPGARMTSAYRSDDLNKAISGASPTSRHRYGLGLDFDFDGHNHEAGARWIRANVHRLQIAPRSVIAEHPAPHLHVDFYDPLKKLDKGSGPTAFTVRLELNKYIALV